jgi:uncharacterized membrane protein
MAKKVKRKRLQSIKIDDYKIGLLWLTSGSHVYFFQSVAWACFIAGLYFLIRLMPTTYPWNNLMAFLLFISFFFYIMSKIVDPEKERRRKLEKKLGLNKLFKKLD